MKLTNELQAEIRRVMDDYWARYFTGDLESWARFLPDDYRNIGSTEEEIWNSKEEVLNYSRAVIDQMAGNVNLRNKQVQVIPYAPYFMVHELGELFIRTGEDWVFYAKFRLSSLIQKADDGWKVLHQHGSFPDAKAQEGESIGFEKISRENQELREAVKRRTVELQHKNRELEVEASLERVRSRSMGMQKSGELQDVIQIIYDQFVQLTIFIEHAGFVVDYTPSCDWNFWVADHVGSPAKITVPDYDSVWGTQFNEAKEKGNVFFATHLNFEEKNSFYQDLFKLVPGVLEETKGIIFGKPGLAISTVLLESVALYIENFSGIPYSEEENATLMRFGKVFQQTYIRFLDLQKAEAQAREAQIEVAVERVRAKALAMHKSEEITGVARILRNELGHLNIEGLFAATIYLEQVDGTVRLWDITIANNIIENGPKSNWDLNVRFEELHPRLFIKRIWGSTEKYFVIEQNEQDFPILIEWVSQFKKEDAEEIERTIKENNIERTWFAGVQLEHGRMSIELFVPPPNEAESILSKIGAAFDLAYKRFLDLQKAEAQAVQAHLDLIQIQTEKARAEDALTELKITQTQLIQKEKLASLGELTAGIAHEIQNPLNFVNNFSEVSTELLAELEDEQQKSARDPELEAELLGDLKQNLQKITHHGQRASGIVRGMLEHARSSTGERQPTDLNALADEYLRLAYHGFLRSGVPAKYKDFNGELLTELDPDLPLVSVIPSDLGRVLLNLFNNAFYALRERQKTAPSDYRPTVTVITGRLGGAVEIRVRDNGVGIPDGVKSKLFQPFFTTKPTGEGTGLGLSLSYDIVTKGHGGSLIVQSVQHQFTEFLIQLPA